ncbi:hypothetical protein [Endozoicomonas sp. ONNA1]|uniref:hypothetical protein n=1 Tax=Endozoicomonas sp. ONNA1 TaxID=2828740 RepID=UPI0021477307|nr:hypothetical protein [Endozoicomonas sp. ONNA1]
MSNKNKNILILMDRSCESLWEHSLPIAADLASSHHEKCSVMVLREPKKSKA